MSVVLESERRTVKARAFVAMLYAVLALGATTMVYPFAVMLTASVSSSYDYRRHSPVVRAAFDRPDRFMRGLAVYFRSFPRELYPDAPAGWSGWDVVARDRDGVKAFAAKELAAAESAGAASGGADEARRYLDEVAAADPLSTRCAYDPRDVASFLKAKYGSIEKLNEAWGLSHRSFFDVSFAAESRVPAGCAAPGGKFADWLELKRYYIDRAKERGDCFARTYPEPCAENAAVLRRQIAMQFMEHGWRDFFESALSNYRLVGEFLFIRGRAFVNTLLLVVLSVLASLTVNPLAAYALSRFRMKSTEKIILFMLATMAFPAAVTAIPGFLLIRSLGLLNTFAALVLPGMASGMSIFVLKGFFDALPRELYEAAAIDGAGEWTVFRRITLPMTTPILAVNALNSFIHAYSSWEWAFLVCQKESHWTLAVWMYQMSQTFAHQPWCVMAGFVIVSIPTAAVFLLCQRVILRGIVLPSMK